MSQKGLSNYTLNNIGEDLNLSEISNISNEISNQNALNDLVKLLKKQALKMLVKV